MRNPAAEIITGEYINLRKVLTYLETADLVGQAEALAQELKSHYPTFAIARRSISVIYYAHVA